MLDSIGVDSYLEYKMMYKVQETNDYECYTSSSEPFKSRCHSFNRI
jgi:hypothetical protein